MARTVLGKRKAAVGMYPLIPLSYRRNLLTSHPFSLEHQPRTTSTRKGKTVYEINDENLDPDAEGDEEEPSQYGILEDPAIRATKRVALSPVEKSSMYNVGTQELPYSNGFDRA